MSKKTPGRRQLAPAESVGPDFVGKTPSEEAQQIEVLRERQMALVEQFGDGLPWHPDHYEAAIRGEMRRGCEAFLRAGRYLIVARECATHGEWGGMLERLGVEDSQARRMMAAARRIEALPNRARAHDLIEAAGTQSKLIELLSLPEDEFTELAESGAGGGVTLDEVEQMTRDELRAALREAKASLADKDRLLGEQQDTVTKTKEELIKAKRKWRAATPDAQRETLEQAVSDAAFAVRVAIASDKEDVGLRGAFRALADHAAEHNLDVGDFLGTVIAGLLLEIRRVRDDEALAVPVPVYGEG